MGLPSSAGRTSLQARDALGPGLWGCALRRPYPFQTLGLASWEDDFFCGRKDPDSGSNPGVAKELHVQRWLSETKSSRLPKGLERGGEAWLGSVFSRREEVSFGLPDHSESVFLLHSLLHRGHPCLHSLVLTPPSLSSAHLTVTSWRTVRAKQGRYSEDRGTQCLAHRGLSCRERESRQTPFPSSFKACGEGGPQRKCPRCPPRPSSGQKGRMPLALSCQASCFQSWLALRVAPCIPWDPHTQALRHVHRGVGTGVEGRTRREGEAALSLTGGPMGKFKHPPDRSWNTSPLHL